MAQISGLPVTMIASVQPGSVTVNSYYNNPSSIWDGFPSSFSCTLDLIATPTSQEPNFLFDGNDLVDGMWLLQPNGNAFLITVELLVQMILIVLY